MWQVFKNEGDTETPIGRPTTWDKANRKFYRLSDKNPSDRYSIGRA